MQPFKDILGREINPGDTILFTEGKSGLTFGLVNKFNPKTLGVVRVSKYGDKYEDYLRVPITSFNVYIVDPLTIPNGKVKEVLLDLLKERFHERYKILQV